MWIDISIIVIIAASALIGVLRGFLKEIISLTAMLGGGWLAINYYPVLGNYLGWENEILKTTVAFILIMVGVIIGGVILTRILAAIISKIGFGVLDRVLGLFFGAARGIFLVLIILLIAQYLGFQQKLKMAKTTHYFQPLINYLRLEMANKDWSQFNFLDNSSDKTIKINEKVEEIAKQIREVNENL